MVFELSSLHFLLVKSEEKKTFKKPVLHVLHITTMRIQLLYNTLWQMVDNPLPVALVPTTSPRTKMSLSTLQLKMRLHSWINKFWQTQMSL